MTPLKKLSFLYVMTLLVVTAAITSVLYFGSRLPQPATTTAARAVLVATPPASAHVAVTDALRTNYDNPLGHLLVQLLVVIALAQLAGRVFKRMGQPVVVGEIVAGIVLGPSLLGWLAPQCFAFLFPTPSLGMLQLLSQIGVCLFMFCVGMELDVRQVRRNTYVAVAVSHVSIAFPYLLGVLLAYFLFSGLGGPGTSFTGFALFTGICMSITAFPVLARILQDLGISRTTVGATALTCAAVDDATAWTILAFIVAIADQTSLVSLSLNTLLLLGFIIGMLIGVRSTLPRLLGEHRMTQETPSHGTLALVVCLLVAASLTTEVIGIHALFGAFLAGAVMPETPGFRHRIGERIGTFGCVLLLPLFFAFTGLRTQIGLLQDLQGWSICLLITAIATLGKLGGGAAAARFTGMNWTESLQLGALMNTRGLMELIVLNIGYDLGILSARMFTMLVIMAVLTTMMTGPLLGLLRRQKHGAAEQLPSVASFPVRRELSATSSSHPASKKGSGSSRCPAVRDFP
jgi:Kef-type K+ transport system membrane component KefB